MENGEIWPLPIGQNPLPDLHKILYTEVCRESVPSHVQHSIFFSGVSSPHKRIVVYRVYSAAFFVFFLMAPALMPNTSKDVPIWGLEKQNLTWRPHFPPKKTPFLRPVLTKFATENRLTMGNSRVNYPWSSFGFEVVIVFERVRSHMVLRMRNGRQYTTVQN